VPDRILVERIMRARPVTLSPDDDVVTAVARLARHRIGSAPVVDSGHHLVGVLSGKDCLRCALRSGYYDGLAEHFVRDLMTKADTVSPHDTFLTAMEVFATRPHRFLPVVDDGVLVGVLMRQDALQTWLRLQRDHQGEERAHLTHRCLISDRQITAPRGPAALERFMRP